MKTKKILGMSPKVLALGALAVVIALGGQYVYKNYSTDLSRSSASDGGSGELTLSCSPSKKIVEPGEAVAFTGSINNARPKERAGIATWQWTAPQGIPNKGTSNNFATQFSPTDGKKHVYQVAVKYGHLQATCSITVSKTTPTPTMSILPSTGIFWRTNQNSDIAKYGNAEFLSGGRGTFFSWCSVEPQPGAYNFSAIDSYIRSWKALGKKAIIGVAAASSADGTACSVGNNANIITVAPSWIYQSPYNVRYIDSPQKAEGTGSTQREYWPIYWDDGFSQRYIMLLTALASHIKQQGLTNDVAWIETGIGKGNTTSVSRNDTYSQYIALSPVGSSEVLFERYWTDFLKKYTSDVAIALASSGLPQMVVLTDYQTPASHPALYYQTFLKEVAISAVANGMLLGGKTVDVNANTMLKKPATFIIPQHPQVATALWNDFTSLGGMTFKTSDFKTNYENAIGGIRGIPATHINYTYLAPNNEVQKIVATHEKGDCPSLPGSGLCYPELTDTVNWILSHLSSLP